MPHRDRDDRPDGTDRESLFDLIYSGQVPIERHIEMLLDRLEREPEPRHGGPR